MAQNIYFTVFFCITNICITNIDILIIFVVLYIHKILYKVGKKMYEKNLSEDFRLRLSKDDMDFLRELSAKRSVSLSECARGIIGEYRRSLETIEVLSKAFNIANLDKGGIAVHGDTKTDINN